MFYYTEFFPENPAQSNAPPHVHLTQCYVSEGQKKQMDWQSHVHTIFPVTADGPLISIHIIQLLIAQFIIVHFITP